MRAQFLLVSLAIILASSCTKGSVDNADLKAITLSPYHLETKAGLYDSSNILTEGEGGRLFGNFSTLAYKTSTKEKYFMGPEWVYYMHYPENPTASGWRFAKQNGQTIEFYNRYWPQTYALDFFAYMPYDLSDSHVTIDKDNQSFSCNLPTDKVGQDVTKEFVYAFSTEQSPESVSTTDGKVPLTFIHPFAAVRFKLGNAHGNTTINSVGFSGIYTQGTFSTLSGNSSQGDLTHNDWTPGPGEKTAISITIGKNIPEDIQIGNPIGDTYIVMPQAFDETSKLTVSFIWDGTNDRSVQLGDGKSWEPGKIYTYTLNLGNSDEDAIASVSVEAWDDFDGYKNDVEVE